MSPHCMCQHVSLQLPGLAWLSTSDSIQGQLQGVYVGLCDRYSICGNVSLDVPVAVCIRAQRA